ncbi:MAG: hypothetical protein ABEJ08_02525 [Halobacteriaceae archaeon]
MSDPYRFPDELPFGTVEAANVLAGADRDLPDDGRVPVGADTRWGAAIELLADLEQRRDIDAVRALQAIAAAHELDTADVERAIRREADRQPDAGDGQWTVTDLAARIESLHQTAVNRNYEGVADQEAARDREIQRVLRAADLDRQAFADLRDRVDDVVGIDLAEIVAPADVTGSNGPAPTR